MIIYLRWAVENECTKDNSLVPFPHIQVVFINHEADYYQGHNVNVCYYEANQRGFIVLNTLNGHCKGQLESIVSNLYKQFEGP